MGNLREKFRVAERVAIVTGGGRGIGRAVALDLAELGAKVVIADIDTGGAKSVADEIKAAGGQALAVKVDVSKKEEVDGMVDQVIRTFDRIDILVNNAGIMGFYSAMDMQEADMDRTVEVNLKGVVLCSLAVAKHMIERRTGKIVNMGSSMSSRASVCNLSGGSADYCASKAAVQSFTRSLAMELSPHGINVNAVAPGPTDTPMHKGMFEMAQAYYGSSVPFGRLAEPEDISSVVAFLVTDAAGFIVGQTLHVNGGQVMVD